MFIYLGMVIPNVKTKMSRQKIKSSKLYFYLWLIEVMSFDYNMQRNLYLSITSSELQSSFILEGSKIMRIHYLQHVPFEGLGSIQTWALEHHHPLSSTKFYQNDRLPSLTEFDCLIVLGGPMNIYEEIQYPWLVAEKSLIKQAITANKIVLGICLGAQLIADVLGAKVYPGEQKEIGWFPIKLTNSADVFRGLPQEMTVFHWHGDTFDMPPGATHLALSEACLNQGFIYNHRVLGLQFHLESTPESVEQIIAHCGDDCGGLGQYIQSPSQMLAHPDRFRQINQTMAQILTNLSIN